MYENYSDMLTVPEVCVMLRVCPCKVYTLLKSGQIRAFKNTRAWYIPKQSVISYIESRL